MRRRLLNPKAVITFSSVLLIAFVVYDKGRKNTLPESLQRGVAGVIGQGHKPIWQKGVVVAQVNRPASDYGSARFDSTLEKLSWLHIEWVALKPMGFQQRIDMPGPIREGGDAQRNVATLTEGIRKIHARGMKAMIMPYLWIESFASGHWRGDIDMKSDEEWRRWFHHYEQFLLHFARICERSRVDLFCIGSEFVKATTQREQDWRQLIRNIRRVYDGPLTYAAAVVEFPQIKFWDELDYIGINAYFPLTENAEATLEDLKQAWQPYLKAIEKIHRRYRKPVIFTEAGYKSSKGSWIKPWQWEWGDDAASDMELDLQAQVMCYEALFQTFWSKPWFYGVYWWKFYSHPDAGGLTDRGFTPQNKPAEEVIRQWYAKPVMRR